MSQYSLSSQTRNYGIDLLRIVSMLMICVIHMNLFTAAHRKIIPDTEFVFYFANWTEAIGIIGVNLYALITGYVCIHGKWKFSRYVSLWCLVAFYTVSLSIVGWGMNCLDIVDEPVYFLHWCKFLLYGSKYWYFAAYTCLFFLIPFLNECLKMLSRERYVLLVLALTILLPLFNTADNGAMLSLGYNLIWLVILYIVGAYIKIYPPVRCRTSSLLCVAFSCSFFPLVCIALGLKYDFFAYTAINNVVYSIALFIGFSRLRVSSVKLRKMVDYFAPAAFSVYLIQCHPWVWEVFKIEMMELFRMLDYPWWFSLVFGVVLYLAASVVDFARIALFRLCRVNAVSDWVAGGIERMVKKLMPKLKRLLE